MEFEYDYLKNPLVHKQGCVLPHSDHRFYASAQELADRVSSFRYDLNGLWKFHYARNYRETISDFQSEDYNCKNWNNIRVPSHIQLEGYDRPQYVNVQYPWEGHEELVPGEVPEEFNPVGSYVKYFTLPEHMQGKRIFLVLEGAESAAAVWLNGQYLGYHEDSFTPAEFELTDFLQSGENKLAVQVFKWCLGSWCEDQDFFRFSGLYRDVYLYAIPETHAWDLNLRAVPEENLQTADFTAKLQLYGKGTVTLELSDGENTVYRDVQPVSEIVKFHSTVDHPHLWSAEDPFLYRCRITVSDESGNICELIEEKVGFRRFELKDGLMCLNGQRIVFNGVNRHEFNSIRGRSLTPEDVERDVRIIKQNNINAIRTSHYPNTSCLYRLCDEYGLYLIDETNMESHGTWDPMGHGEDAVNAVPNNRIEWQEMMLERSLSMYERDKNHASILIWSCGNESFGGSVIYDMSRLFKDKDDTRLVHYEGIFHDRSYPDTSDMESQMYTPVTGIEKFLKEHPEKPFICCEYSHAMGNSCGGLHKYIDLTRREPRYQGGFIWDFADQALVQKNRFGEDYLAYGGDFGDRPTDGNFCGNGLVSGDRQISPKMQEVKYLYQNMDIQVKGSEVTIANRNLFLNTDHWMCLVKTEHDGVLTDRKVLETHVAPSETRTYPLDLPEMTKPGYWTVTVSFCLKENTLWAAHGHEVAFGQECLHVDAPAPVCHSSFRVIHSKHNIGVRGDNFEALFSVTRGGLTSYRYGGREMLDATPMPSFWRAPTDNDRGNRMAARYGQWKLASLYAYSQGSCLVEENSDSAVISCSYCLPTTPQASCEIRYQVFSSGKIQVTVHQDPVKGLSPMPEFGMMLQLNADLENLSWYGLGPADTYWDRCSGGKTGLYRNRVQDNLAPYLMPQECGNKEHVHWAEVTDLQGRGLRFEAGNPEGCSFSALPYTPHQLEDSDHWYELPRPVHTVVRISAEQMGIGGDDSWGARTHEEYLIPADQEHTFTFSFQGI